MFACHGRDQRVSRLAQLASGSAKIVVQALTTVVVRCERGGLMAG